MIYMIFTHDPALVRRLYKNHKDNLMIILLLDTNNPKSIGALKPKYDFKMMRLDINLPLRSLF